MAKIIRKPGTYLEDQGGRFLVRALSLMLLALVLAIALHPVYGALPLPWAVRAGRRYLRYAKGLAGEGEVRRVLEQLDDSYYVIHDAELPRANIDHIVLGPNGVFVLETKHFSGWVECEGDRWWVARNATGRRFKLPRSPSVQVKRNAAMVRERIRKFETTVLKGFPLAGWVQAVVVLSHPDAHLELLLPPAAVDVVKVSELVDRITATPPRQRLPAPVLTKMGLALLGMKSWP